MIDKKLEPYYDKLLSIFIGVVIVLIIHNLYDSPRNIIVISDKQYMKQKCDKLCS